ncbi:putative FERM domain-containing protein FRMD8P1 [Ylistrum balloti]|uniref:putative FERM domain-containing protein FRMD8P1 n=1 Tax=Ylistrum balloti TaxID=509963 RepID=UPI002905EE8F|nr:putative FERM domain-containing protein FRMD8P1 [Ylistrum balloti]
MAGVAKIPYTQNWQSDLNSRLSDNCKPSKRNLRTTFSHRNESSLPCFLYNTEIEESEKEPIYPRDHDHGDLEGEDTVEMVIWLRDRTGLHLELQGNGHQAKVSELFQKIQESRNLPENAHTIFSLWMVSPLLEFRLKDDHQPFEIAQLWDRFCLEYADSSMDDIARDEPVVMVQRNVFLSRKDEKLLWDTAPEEVMSLLYHEAKYNIIRGRYLLSDSDYDNLAGIQALLEKGPFTRDLESYKDDLKNYYPHHLCKNKKLRGRKAVTAERLKEAHQLAFSNTGDMTKQQLCGQYLTICAKYPFYGGAFFDAVLQKPTGNISSMVNRSLARGFPERDVTVTINTEGICVIDDQEKEVLLTVPYEQLSWDYVNRREGSKMPTLYIQFLTKADESTRVLQIYSKQAPFMDALVDTCVRKKQDEQSYDKSEDKNETFCYGICNKLDRLCLKKYSLTGQSMDN